MRIQPAILGATLGLSLACGGMGPGGAVGGGGHTPVELAGTRWHYSKLTADERRIYEFLADGTVIRYDDNNAAVDTWTRSGDNVSMVFNGGGLTYEGQMLGDHTIVGTGTAGTDTWDFRMIRIPSPAELACEPITDVSGTRWRLMRVGNSGDGALIDFIPGGRFLHHEDNSASPDSWTQSGTQVNIQVNEGLSYEGTMIGGHTIIGIGKTSDETWNIRMLREPTPGELICR